MEGFAAALDAYRWTGDPTVTNKPRLSGSGASSAGSVQLKAVGCSSSSDGPYVGLSRSPSEADKKMIGEVATAKSRYPRCTDKHVATAAGGGSQDKDEPLHAQATGCAGSESATRSNSLGGLMLERAKERYESALLSSWYLPAGVKVNKRRRKLGFLNPSHADEHPKRTLRPRNKVAQVSSGSLTAQVESNTSKEANVRTQGKKRREAHKSGRTQGKKKRQTPITAVSGRPQSYCDSSACNSDMQPFASRLSDCNMAKRNLKQSVNSGVADGVPDCLESLRYLSSSGHCSCSANSMVLTPVSPRDSEGTPSNKSPTGDTRKAENVRFSKRAGKKRKSHYFDDASKLRQRTGDSQEENPIKGNAEWMSQRASKKINRSLYFKSDEKPLGQREIMNKDWVPPVSVHALIQEELYQDPWKVLVACMLLNKTSGLQMRRVVWDLFALCPTPEVAVKTGSHKIEDVIQSLGLQKKRARMIQKFSEDYLGDGWTNVSELHGIGKYATDAYAIFCEGRWQEVRPEDHKLTDYWRFLCDTDGQGYAFKDDRICGQTPKSAESVHVQAS